MARPREFQEDRVVKAVRIPRELDDAVKALARDRQVSANLVITWAIEDYLERAADVRELRHTG